MRLRSSLISSDRLICSGNISFSFKIRSSNYFGLRAVKGVLPYNISKIVIPNDQTSHFELNFYFART